MFDGGNAQDPDGKEGIANFLAGMLDEGAGDLTSQQFQERMEKIAMRMSFDDARDAFYGSFETLTQHRDDLRASVRTSELGCVWRADAFPHGVC